MEDYTIITNRQHLKGVPSRKPVERLKLYIFGNQLRLKLDIATNQEADRKKGEIKKLFEDITALVNQNWVLEDNIIERTRKSRNVIFRKNIKIEKKTREVYNL